MKVIRKGNDILIMWYVTRMGEPENFDGKKIEVRLLDKYNSKVPFEYTVSGNVITGTFFGRSQSIPGPYHLMLIENEDKKGQVILDSKEIFAIRDYIPDTTSVGGDHIADMVEVKVDSNINSLAGLCVTKLWYNDGTGACGCEDCTGNDSEAHEYNLMDVEVIVPEGYTGMSAKVYSKENVDAMRTSLDHQIEDGIANLHDTITEEMTEELSYKLDKTEYEANRAADKAELDSYKTSQSAEFEAYVTKQKAEFDAYVTDARKELEAAQTKAKNDLDEYADDFQSEYETFKTNNTLLINAKANTTDVAAADATLQANIDSVRSSLQTNIDSVKSTLQSNIDSVRSSLQTNIDTNKAAFDSHVTNAKVEFDAHVAAAQKSLDDHIADFTTEQGVFDAYKLSMQQALDGYVAQAKSDLDKHAADAKAQLDNHIVEFTSLKEKVESDVANLAALQAAFDAYKVNVQSALDGKVDNADLASDKAALQSNIDAVVTSLNTHKAEFKAYKVSNQTALDGKVDKTTLATEKATLQANIDAANAALNAHKTDFDAYKVNVQSAIDTKAAKTDVVADIAKAKADMKANMDEHKTEVATQLAGLESTINTTKTDIAADLADKATREYVDTAIVSRLGESVSAADLAATRALMQEKIDVKADKTEVEAVDAKVDAIVIPTKVSELENDSNYLTEHQDISGKANVSDLAAKADKTYVDTELAKKATPEDISTAISNIEIPDPDLSGYYTKPEVNDLLATKANKTEIPSIEGLATEDYVDQAVANATGVDMSNLATKTEVQAVDAKVDAIEIPDTSSFATKTEVQAVDAKVDAIEIPDTSSFATKTEVQAVDAKVDAIEIPDTSSFATKTELTTGLAGKANTTDIPDTSNLLTKTEAEDTYVQAGDGLDQALYDMSGVDTTAFGATVSRVTDLETSVNAMIKTQKVTQAEYDALTTKDANTLYAIV